MWDFYKQDYSFVINQLSTLLLDISKLDKDLSWSCQIILDRYKKDFNVKHKKSFYVENNYLELDILIHIIFFIFGFYLNEVSLIFS